MKVLHLLSGGGLGGIEVLCKNIADYSHADNEFVFLFTGGKIADQLEAEGRKICRLYRSAGRIGRLFRLRKAVKQNRYDVIIVHHASLGMFLYYIFLMITCPHIMYIKYLHSAFDKKYYYRNSRLYNGMIYLTLRYIFARSHHIVAVSEFVKQSFLGGFSCEEERIRVIYNGIEAPGLQERERTKKGGIFRILYIGRLAEEKGLQVLLKAAAILDKAGKDSFTVTLVGTGSCETDLAAMAKEYGLEQKVCFAGETLEKEQYFRQADLFVYPSVCQEAFGISIVEAMARGLVCAASDSGGIPEVIHDGENGFLFPAGDARELAECLRKCMEMNTVKWEEMQREACQTAERFQISRTVEELEKLYDVADGIKEAAAFTAGDGKRSKTNM